MLKAWHLECAVACECIKTVTVAKDQTGGWGQGKFDKRPHFLRHFWHPSLGRLRVRVEWLRLRRKLFVAILSPSPPSIVHTALVRSPPDDLCIDIWISAMIPER